MNRIEQQVLVEQLSRDTLRAIDDICANSPIASQDIIVYVGYKELMAIRYINRLYYYSDGIKETFMGCRLIGVKQDSYFHITPQGKFYRAS